MPDITPDPRHAQHQASSLANSSAARQYLARHAEPELQHLASLNLAGYRHCLVVPAYRETRASLDGVWSHLDPQLIIICVINSWHEDDPQSQALLASYLAEAPREMQASENLYYLPRDSAPDLLIVDRCSAGRLLPRRQGVGLARKIGADLGLLLISSGQVSSHWIHSTDADVTLPADYFEVPAPGTTTAALVRAFEHEYSNGLELAARLYEISMHYYVLGLQAAGSRHAFHAIGSTLSVNALHYAQVRGFPRRNAAEDFYLLNKLAKVGQVQAWQGAPIRIAARLSDRAPFGTGPAIATIDALAAPLTDYPFYHPGIFQQLGVFLGRISQLSHQPPLACFQDHEAICHWITESGLLTLLEDQQQKGAPTKVVMRLLQDWFDGFRTLKFIHFMRDHYYPSCRLQDICTGQLMPEMSIDSLASVRAVHAWARQQTLSEPHHE